MSCRTMHGGTCRQCEQPFRRVKWRGDSGLFCSRACSFVWRRARREEKEAALAKAKNCKRCGAAADRVNGYCSDACRKASAYATYTARYRAANPITPRQCVACQRAFVPTKSNYRSICSMRCSRAMNPCNPRRRARKHGVAYEPVNPIRVFMRDGWKCQICGKRTPADRRGSRYPNAPELDHRQPISMGGPHRYDNTQTACRACNNRKGNRSSIGQMPLLSHAAQATP